MIFRVRMSRAFEAAARRDAALKVQMIFQDPMSSLNPRLRVKDIVGEAPRVHGIVTADGVEDHVRDIMLKVGLFRITPAVRTSFRWPAPPSPGRWR